LKFFCEKEHVLSHLYHFQQFLPLLSLATLRIQRLGELCQHRLELPDSHDEIEAARLEVAAEVGDRVDKEGGAIGANLVEAENGEDGEGVIVGNSEALIVEEAEVVMKPDKGGTTALEGSRGQ